MYSCSTSGSCRVCKKYGDQQKALRKPAPPGGKCATGSQIGAHHSCRMVFQSTDENKLPEFESEKEGAQDEPMKRAGAVSTSTSDSSKALAVLDNEETLDKEETAQQPEDIIVAVEDKNTPAPDSEEEADDKAPAYLGPVCCKCSTRASNGETVYFCSASGSCSICKKYGGQASAFRKLPPSESTCAKGSQKGTHYSCRKLFESMYETTLPMSEGATKRKQDESIKRDAHALQKEETVHQTESIVGAADDRNNSAPYLEKEASVQIDANMPEDQAPAAGPVCCKCSAPASNGKTVYSCSASGSCRVCKKYGGQKNAIRMSAPSSGKCASGNKTGAHYDCSQLFERETKDLANDKLLKSEIEKGDEQQNQKKRDAYEVWRKNVNFRFQR